MSSDPRPTQRPPEAPSPSPGAAAACAALRVEYCAAPAADLLARPGTLAVFGFGEAHAPPRDPRYLQVELPAADGAAPRECWSVGTTVTRGAVDAVRSSRGGGWRFLALEVDEAPAGNIAGAARAAYDALLGAVEAGAERHILRIWNYLYAINDGAGDAERYRQFCNGRAASLAAHGLGRYPAATAIGHRGHPGRLQVYALCSSEDGTAVENPRQVSAWNYPRRYGPTSPQFARAMRLPGGSLAISGTAAVLGHASSHAGDAVAQAREAIANLHALRESAGLPPFDAASPLKVYVRRAGDVDAVRRVLDAELDPAVPRLLLRGDVCRRELLVEIDGWRLNCSHLDAGRAAPGTRPR